MNRKEAIHFISILLGGTLVGANAFLTGCRSTGASNFNEEDIAYLDEIADTILPPTKTPGAKAAHTGQFIARMIDDCYDEKETAIFRKGMDSLNEIASKKYSQDFTKLKASERHELLVVVDNEQKQYMKDKKETEPVHYFRMMKELTLLGYFTSKEGVTQAKRYLPVPGKYIGCVPYKKGDKAIA
jgi:hypothetical protein